MFYGLGKSLTNYLKPSETGLLLLTSRFYDPEICRFISADDIRFINPSLISGLNLFAYCNNNPIMNFDPSGNFAISITLGIVGLVKLAGNAGILGVNVSRTETTMDNYVWFYQVETGTSAGISSGRPINITFSAPRRLWRFWEYSMGLDVNINGRGGGLNLGTQTSIAVHTGGGNSHAFGGNMLGRVFHQRSWKDEFGNTHFIRNSINLPESYLTAVAAFGLLFIGYKGIMLAGTAVASSTTPIGGGAVTALFLLMTRIRERRGNEGDIVDKY